MLLRVGMGDSTCALVHILFKPQTTESLGIPLHCSQWRQSRTPGSLTLVSVTTKHKSLHWACNRHMSIVGLLTVPGLAGKTAPGDFFHCRQSLLPSHSGMKWVSSRILFKPSWSKKQVTTSLIFLALKLWQLRKSRNSCTAQLHLRGRGWTNFSPLFNDWDDAGPTPTITSSYLESLGIYLRELLSHRGEVLSGLRISFWKRSVSPSSPGVFLWCFGFVFGWVCFGLF